MTKMTLSKLNRGQRLSFLLLAAGVLFADQITKALIRANMYLGQSIPPEGTFRLTYVTNPYGVFGFSGFWDLYMSPISFIIGTGIVVILIIGLYFSYPPMRSKLASIGLGCLLGGAMGNLIDRIMLGAVTDFIDVRLWEGFRWPTFNIADASLTTGIFILIVCLLVITKDTQ
ncbi:signal peptidase II [Dehalococcoidia bacterium]|nr:signal peptidase II [Dehalococcoidia bacterium]